MDALRACCQPFARRAAAALLCLAAQLFCAAVVRAAGEPGCSNCSAVDGKPKSPLVEGKLAACPSAPHCVGSDDADEAHRVPPFVINGDATATWAALKAQLRGLPRVDIVEESADYMHATATSSIMHFVDDVEFALHAERGEIAVRSASRVGYYDFHVNRARIEALRTALHDKGLLKN